MINIDLRTRIFLRALGLLWALILAVTWVSGASSVTHQREYARTIYQGQVRTLALQMANQVMWDDRVGLHELLVDVVGKDEALGYAFLEHDGKPYVYTSPAGVPKGLLGMGQFSMERATVTPFKDQAGGRWFDIAQAVPANAAVLHLGVNVEVLFWQALRGLRGVLAVSGAVLLAAALFAWNIAGATTREVRARQQAEEELRGSRDDLIKVKEQLAERTATRRLIEASLDPLVTINPEGKITDANKATEDVTGVSREKLIGSDFSDYFTEPDRARQGYQQAFAKGFVTDYSLALRRRDGHITDVLYNASVYRNEAGKVLGVFAAARDITERNKAEQDVAQLSMRNRLILDSTGEGLYGLDIDGKCTFVNPAAVQLLGFKVDELVGQHSHTLFHHTKPDGRPYPVEECPIQTVYKHGSVHRGSDLYWRKDGSSLPVEFISTPILETGKITGAVVAFRDITELKLAEEQLRRSEHGLIEAQRISHLGSWELDLENNVLTCSDEIYRIFEIDPEKFSASYEAFLNVIHPEDREIVSKAYTDSVKDKLPYDIVHRLQMQDGRIKYVNEKCETYYGENGKPLRSVGTVYDITERKLDEEALQRLNRELRTISNCNQTLMRAEDEQALLDDICRIVCDEAGYRMAWVGYLENDEGKTIRPVAWAGVETQYLELAGLTWADTERGRGPSGLAIRTGERAGIEDFANDPKAAPWRDDALQRGYRSSISLPLKDERANTFGVLNIYSTAPGAFTMAEVRLLGELAGDLAFGITVLRARNERKQAEEKLRMLNENLEQRVREETAKNMTQERLLIQQSRLAAMGEMIHNIAHQWRQPINALTLLLANIKDAYEFNELTKEYLDSEVKAGQRLIQGMSTTIDDFRNFFMPNKEKEFFLTGVSMLDAIKLVNDSFAAHSIKIIQEKGIEPCIVFGYPNEFAQVVLNILTNAKEAIASKNIAGEIHVKAAKDGNMVIVSICDNGGGIPEGILPKVFDPYFTTKESGSGIGLFMSKMIMNNMGGNIAIRNVEDGVEVRLTLPLATPAT